MKRYEREYYKKIAKILYENGLTKREIADLLRIAYNTVVKYLTEK